MKVYFFASSRCWIFSLKAPHWTSFLISFQNTFHCLSQGLTSKWPLSADTERHDPARYRLKHLTIVVHLIWLPSLANPPQSRPEDRYQVPLIPCLFGSTKSKSNSGTNFRPRRCCWKGCRPQNKSIKDVRLAVIFIITIFLPALPPAQQTGPFVRPRRFYSKTSEWGSVETFSAERRMFTFILVNLLKKLPLLSLSEGVHASSSRRQCRGPRSDFKITLPSQHDDSNEGGCLKKRRNFSHPCPIAATLALYPSKQREWGGTIFNLTHSEHNNNKKQSHRT